MEVFLISFTAACCVSRHNLCAVSCCSEKCIPCSPLSLFEFHILLCSNTAPMAQRRHSRHDGNSLGALRRVWLNVVNMDIVICHLYRTAAGEYCARTILLSRARVQLFCLSQCCRAFSLSREHYLVTWRTHR
ncbi:hypothetical protein TRVL_07763 [Trypanosoma vivax]|nr:hypothetical protein TRVL_07763 [Trypanosoma vivax]